MSVTDSVFVAENNNGEAVKGMLSYITKVRYGLKGNKLEESYFMSDGKLLLRSIFHYDSKGRETEKKDYDTNGYLTHFYNYIYDSSGDMVEESACNSNGCFYLKYKSIYNDRHELVELDDYKFHDKLLYKYLFKYDKDGKRVNEDGLHADKSFWYKRSFKYDNNGNITEILKYAKSGGKPYRESYVIKDSDDKGNWLTQIKSENDVPREITLRKIKYYSSRDLVMQ